MNSDHYSSEYHFDSFGTEDGEDDTQSEQSSALESEVRALKTESKLAVIESKLEVIAWMRATILVSILAIVATVTAEVGWERYASEKEEHQKTRIQAQRMAENRISKLTMILHELLQKNMHDHPTDIPTEEDHPAATSEPDHQ